jgi:hypothetical protein
MGSTPKSFTASFVSSPGFLTGILQNHARKYDLPIDELAFHFSVISVYRDQAEVIAALADLKFGEELAQDEVVSLMFNIGVRRRVSKRVEDCRRLPALRSGHPRKGCKAVSGVVRPQGVQR